MYLEIQNNYIVHFKICSICLEPLIAPSLEDQSCTNMLVNIRRLIELQIKSNLGDQKVINININSRFVFVIKKANPQIVNKRKLYFIAYLHS